MTIGIEAERANNPQKTGVEHYAQQLILHLADIDHTNNYILYLRTKPQDWFLNLPKNFQIKVMPFPVFWTQLRISWEMLFHPVDALFIPASALPIIHPKKSVVTIHDLAWKYFPETFTWFNRNFLEWSTRFAVRSASEVIAVSNATKKDLVKEYGIDEKKVAVIHHGFELSDKWQVTSDKLELPQKYILFISTLQPRKNLIGLISAFRALKHELPELPHLLVVVGYRGWKYEKILRAIEDNKDMVKYIDRATEDEKAAILRGANLLVQPSFYEGFGMQILEAFAAGVPVATSNISSMPEVAEDAAIYFDPKDINQIKNAIKNVLLDRSLHDQLIEKGKKRLQLFSWEKCAKETLEVLKS